MNIVFFKRPQPKRFDYKPLYYDERKDELEQRKKKFEITDNEEKKEAIKSEIHYRWGLHRKASKGKGSVTTMIFYIVAMVILIMFVYYLLKSVGIDLTY
ncbi:hypothetical protein ACFLRZ_01450 [Bacteroidota bacterium]